MIARYRYFVFLHLYRVGLEHNALMAIVCLSIRLEGHSELKLDRKEAHETGESLPHLEVKVSRLLNSVTENQPYLLNQKSYKLQTW